MVNFAAHLASFFPKNNLFFISSPIQKKKTRKEYLPSWMTIEDKVSSVSGL